MIQLSETTSSIRDPLYGLIQLTSPELSILKSIPVTRMRWIKQMGLACLVFPGANHTRFEHSVGTLHVADKLLDALVKKTEDDFLTKNVQAVRLAALLHDLGHSPFSHVTEEFYRITPKYLPDRDKNYDHEAYTEALIRENGDIKILCKEEDINLRFLSRLACGKSDTFLDDLISSSIDVDKIDYVARDSYFCGLPYGRIDLSSLAEGISLTENALGKEILAFDWRSRDAVEGLLMSRFYLMTTIHVHERNCAANQLLFRAMTKAYDLVLKPAIKEDLDNDVKRLILECLHFRWVDHDLTMFLEDPFQKLRISAIEASREKFSSLNYEALHGIIQLVSAQPIKRRTRYFSHVLLNRVLRGRIPKLRYTLSITQLPPSMRYSLYVLYSNSDFTELIDYLKRSVQKLNPYKGKGALIAVTAPKPLEMNARIMTGVTDCRNLFDMSLLMRSLAIETANRLTLSIFSQQKPSGKISFKYLEALVHWLCSLLRRNAIRQHKYFGTDLILMLYYYLYRGRSFFEGDMRFQALFTVVFNQIMKETYVPYGELVELPKSFGNLNEAENYKNFRNSGYPDFYSVKFAQDVDLLAEMGLIYSRSGPVQVPVSKYAKRYERRISHYGREYVERYLLRRYLFSNKLREIVEEMLLSDTPLIKLGI